MKRFTLLSSLVAALMICVTHAAAGPPPNFILINIDDLGYADIGPFGSTRNRTPNLDRMAKEGRRLTSFYAAPVCSPSRAALMTGCYPKRVLPIPHVLFPGNDVGLAPDEITVAEVLHAKGYATACVGKWHLGDQPEFLPRQQGFDFYFGLPYSNDMGPAEDGVKSNLGDPLPKNKKGKGQPPLPLLRDNTVLQRVLAHDQTTLVKQYTEEAVAWLTAHKDKPFFLYLPHSAVHFPLYPGKDFQGKSKNGLYGDWVEEVDWSVGQVLNAVRQLNLTNTLVIFTSDNGGTPRGFNTPLRGHKGSVFEGGMRVPTLAWWPGHILADTSTDAITGMIDILPTFTAMAGGELPKDRHLDGANISDLLLGQPDAKPVHETFFYHRGLELQAIRSGLWKLHLKSGELHHLGDDISEANNVAAQHPDIVAKLRQLAEAADADLGIKGIGPGVRPLGKVKNAQPLIGHDGTIRPGFEPKATP